MGEEREREGEGGGEERERRWGSAGEREKSLEEGAAFEMRAF